MGENEVIHVQQENLVPANSPMAALLNPEIYNHLKKVAVLYSNSDLVPAHFKGKPENTFIGLQMALRWEMDPFMVLQNLYVIHGKPGIEGKLVIGLMNARGPFEGPVAFEIKGTGMDMECTAYGIVKATGNREACTVTMKIAKAEGWMSKSGSKWQTMPEQMLKYRSATWLARTACPEVLLGLQTVDEVKDIQVVVKDPTAKKTKRTALLKDKIKDLIPPPSPGKDDIEDAEVVEPKTLASPAEELYNLISFNGKRTARKMETDLLALIKEEYPEAWPTVRPDVEDIQAWMEGDAAGATNVLQAARKKYNKE